MKKTGEKMKDQTYSGLGVKDEKKANTVLKGAAVVAGGGGVVTVGLPIVMTGASCAVLSGAAYCVGKVVAPSTTDGLASAAVTATRETMKTTVDAGNSAWKEFQSDDEEEKESTNDSYINHEKFDNFRQFDPFDGLD